MSDIKVGIVGCGHLGYFHIKNLIELQKERKDFEIIGVFDLDRSKSDKINKEFNLKIFDSLLDLFENINTAIIVTPTTTHYNISRLAIEKNINAFIEKPITDKISDANELLEFANIKNVKIQVGHIERYNPALLALEDMELNPLFIESHRLSEFNPRGADVSVIMDLMIHDIDIILSLVNSKIISIEANGVAVITDKIDIANARLNFENGCVANLTASRISLKKMRKMRIFQKNAYISIDFMKSQSEIFSILKEGTSIDNPKALVVPMEYDNKIIRILYESKTVSNINPMKFELNKFFDSIVENIKPEVDIEAAVEAVEAAQKIIDKINKSVKFTG
jgi:predicted dehydrogenase